MHKDNRESQTDDLEYHGQDADGAGSNTKLSKKKDTGHSKSNAESLTKLKIEAVPIDFYRSPKKIYSVSF